MESDFRNALQRGEELGLRYALQIPQVAATGLTGARTGLRSGSSIDFQDYREYQPGDDLRFIDWGIYARTDRLTVKLFREEVTPHLDLILDGSRSMALTETAKSTAAATLAGLLATAAANTQCSRAVWQSGEGYRRLANDTLPPSTWDGLAFQSERTPEQSLTIMAPHLRRMGMRILVSDLLWAGDPLPLLKRLRDGAAALFVVQILSREDITPPEQGNIRIVDSETKEEAEIFVDAGVVQQYSQNLSRLQQGWADACRQCGAHLTTIVAEDLETSLSELETMQLLTPA